MITLALAGTTHHTVQCAQALLDSGKYSIPWILTPAPKPIGRKKIVTKNPLNTWAEQNNIPIIHVEKKIDHEIKSRILDLGSPEFLLVVDFGYLIPQWLLDLPTIAPLNIHPSQLPKYRGSSPAQFALLYGEKESAVTVMKMSASLDTGDVLRQIPFTIQPNWDSAVYYTHAFHLVTQKLPAIIENIVKTPVEHRGELFIPQPETSPTPIARRLTKEDGYVPWKTIQLLLTVNSASDLIETDGLSPLFQDVLTTLPTGRQAHHSQLTTVLSNAVRALSPWPNLWTIVPTTKGDKRMKILEVETLLIPEHSAQAVKHQGSATSLTLKKVQIEGLGATTFEEVKNQIRG